MLYSLDNSFYLLNLCISILEFKFSKKGGDKLMIKNLCISILEFKF